MKKNSLTYWKNIFIIRDKDLSLASNISFSLIMILSIPFVFFIVLFLEIYLRFENLKFKVKFNNSKILVNKLEHQYIIHFLGANGKFEEKFSIRVTGKIEKAFFEARWHSCFSRYLTQIPYWVEAIGLFTDVGYQLANFPIYTNKEDPIYIAPHFRHNPRIKYICEVDRKQIYLDHRHAKRLFN